MNLDELAKNVMSAGEGLQFIQNPSSNPMFLQNINHGTLCTQPQLNTLGNDTSTLEDFLIRASVIKSGNKFDDHPVIIPMTTPMPIQSYSNISFENHQAMDVVYPEKITANLAMESAATTSNGSQLSGERKRSLADEKMEKSIERRQRRMIKNRESAARSRARKQAYTKQLEHEVLELRKTNSWLKKQKEFEKHLCSNAPSKPRYQLRRTSSAAL